MSTAAAVSMKERVLSTPLPALIERLKKEEKVTHEEATQMVKDMLMFLYLCGSSLEPCAPTQMIDAAWHGFILFTREYREFCQVNFGKFIDHVPNDEGFDPEVGRQVALRTIQRAREEFGDLSNNWTSALKATASCNGNSCSFTDCTKCSGTTNCQNTK